MTGVFSNLETERQRYVAAPYVVFLTRFLFYDDILLSHDGRHSETTCFDEIGLDTATRLKIHTFKELWKLDPDYSTDISCR